jgi:hypothetical protein
VATGLILLILSGLVLQRLNIFNRVRIYKEELEAMAITRPVAATGSTFIYDSEEEEAHQQGRLDDEDDFEDIIRADTTTKLNTVGEHAEYADITPSAVSEYSEDVRSLSSDSPDTWKAQQASTASTDRATIDTSDDRIPVVDPPYSSNDRISLSADSAHSIDAR